MPCGSHWCRHWWSTMSEGPDLGGSDCGQQVPRALSVCIITHFLHQVICLGTRGKRHTRGSTARGSSYINAHFECDHLRIYGDYAVNAANIGKQVHSYCALIQKRHHALRVWEHRKQQVVTLCQTAHPPLLQLSVNFRGSDEWLNAQINGEKFDNGITSCRWWTAPGVQPERTLKCDRVTKHHLQHLSSTCAFLKGCIGSIFIAFLKQ